MTVTRAEAAELSLALENSHDPDWEVRSGATAVLGRFSNEPQSEHRLIEMLSDPDNISVIEAAAVALAATDRGLTRLASVYDSLDDQAGSYAAVAVSDSVGDSIFVRLLSVIRATGDEQVRDGARHLGEHIGMRTSPLWEQAFPPQASAH